MRLLGVDVGLRRIGLAISDASGTLARPLTTLTIHGNEGVERVALEVARLAAEEDGLATIVVGLPAHLDGTPTKESSHVNAFIEGLHRRTGLPVVAEDERLTSREAESRLALREKDWKKRKQRLDSAAAAIILQDYLDRRRPT